MTSRRVLGSALVGAALPHFEAVVDASAFVGLPPGSQASPVFALVIAYLARPLGALALGSVGDRIGRRRALLWAVSLAATASFALGLLLEGALLGALLRFLQAFGLGGCWAGAVLLAVERAPERKRARYGLAAQLGLPLGYVAAQVPIALLSPEQARRVPYLASALFVVLLLGWLPREEDEPRGTRSPVAELLRDHARPWIVGTFAVGVCFVLLGNTASLGLRSVAPGSIGSLWLGLIAAALLVTPAIVAGAFLSDRYSPRAVLMGACLLSLAASAATGPTLSLGLGGMLLMLPMDAVPLGLSHAAIASFLPSLFPERVRYTGVALSFAVGASASSVIWIAVARHLTALNIRDNGAALAASAAISLIALCFAPKAQREQGLLEQPSV